MQLVNGCCLWNSSSCLRATPCAYSQVSPRETVGRGKYIKTPMKLKTAEEGNWADRFSFLSSNLSLARSVLFAWIQWTDCASMPQLHTGTTWNWYNSDSRDFPSHTACFTDPEQGCKQIRCLLAFPTLIKLWKTLPVFPSCMKWDLHTIDKMCCRLDMATVSVAWSSISVI